jgi:chaperonin cofactor prefoldin
MNKIIIESENIQLHDEELRKIVEKLWNRVQELNERTKRQTTQINELKKKLGI